LQTLRTLEQELAARTARLDSLEDLDRTRAAYADAARMVLADQGFGHLGAVADYLEVSPGYERAIEACLGEVLQHVVVRTHEQALAGLELIRRQSAGHCGFLVLEQGQEGRSALERPRAGVKGLVELFEVVTVNGPWNVMDCRAVRGRGQGGRRDRRAGCHARRRRAARPAPRLRRKL
jgi:chromosome segregation protein